MEKLWSKTEITHLKRHAGTRSVEELAQRLHTDPKTVRRKLTELGLTATSSTRAEVDAALEHYTEGLRLLHEGRYAEAAERFDLVVVEADRRQLADRARQQLAICRRQTAEAVIPEDPYLRAIFEKNRGNFAAALELCAELGNEAEDERIAYLRASLRALMGAQDEALEELATAIRLEPRNRVHAYHDPDFASLRRSQEFASLLSAS